MGLRDMLRREKGAKKSKVGDTAPKAKLFAEQSDAYKAGWRDADRMFAGGFSKFFVRQTFVHLGFTRKDEKQSDEALFDYCDGAWDRIERETRGKNYPHELL